MLVVIVGHLNITDATKAVLFSYINVALSTHAAVRLHVCPVLSPLQPTGKHNICVTDFLVNAVRCLHRHIFVTRRKIVSYTSRLIPQHTF